MPTNELKTKIIQIKLGNNKKFIEPINFNDENLVLNDIATRLISGVEIIVFNTYDLTPHQSINLGAKIKQLCAEFDGTFILKGKIDVAYILRPDAVILDKQNIDIHHTREILGEDCLIGFLGEVSQDETPDFIINEHAFTKEIPIFKATEDINNPETLILQRI